MKYSFSLLWSGNVSKEPSDFILKSEKLLSIFGSSKTSSLKIDMVSSIFSSIQAAVPETWIGYYIILIPECPYIDNMLAMATIKRT